MMTKPTTESLIADLLDAPYASSLDARAKYLVRESLYSLVRLAKAEQMMEIKQSVEKLTGIGAGYGTYSLIDEIAAEDFIFNDVQQRFEFHDPK